MKNKASGWTKRCAAWTMIILMTIVLFYGVLITVRNGSVRAVEVNGTEQGSRATMYKKLSYGALEACLKNLETFNSEQEWYNVPEHLGLKDFTVKSSDIKDGRWFPNGKSTFNEASRNVGALLELKVSGQYKDGKIWCGENNNQLMKRFVDNPDYLNLQSSHKEIFCADNKYRIFRKGTYVDSCEQTFDDPSAKFLANAWKADNATDVSRDTSEVDYLDNIVKDTAFSDDIPGNSLYDMTDLEQYFLLYDTFINVCVAGDGSDDDTLSYGIYMRKQGTNEYEKKYFSEKIKPKSGTKILLRMKGSKKVKMSCKAMAAILGDENSDELKAYKDYIDVVGSEGEEEEPETAVSNKICFDKSGMIGWIICPIIEAGAEIGSYMYQEIETDFLQVHAEKMFESGGGLETVWKIFRDIANIVFIIFFMVVIYSQLTGLGIDNYGIKKALPKIIVVAILINLSYVLCALAVDLSNILGLGLNTLFTTMAAQVEVTMVEPTFLQSVAGAGLVGGGVVLFALITNPVGAITFSTVAVAVGMAVLGIVVSVGISIFFMYLALMVRNLGIVLLIAISPIAIVCYMLPNLDKLTKKWYEMLKALLVLYPICGLLVGAGKLAGRLLASFDTPAMVVAGMVTEVVPFFMLPKALKASLQMIGRIGDRLSDAGRRYGRNGSTRIRGSITASDRYKDWSKLKQKQQERRSAEKTRNRLLRKKTLTKGQSEKLARVQNILSEHEADREKMYQGAFMRNDRGTNKKEFANALRGNDPEKASAGLSSLMQQGGEGDVLDVLNSKDLDWNQMDPNVKNKLVQTMGGSNMNVLKGFSKYQMSGGSAGFNDWATGNISDEMRKKDADAGIKLGDGSYAQYLMGNGPNAMNNLSKDDMEFIQVNADKLRGEMGNDVFGNMLGNAAVYNNDPKSQSVAEQMITSELSNTDNNRLTMQNLNLTPKMFGDMRKGTADAIYQGELGNVRATNDAMNPAMFSQGSMEASQAEIRSMDYTKRAMQTAFSPQARQITSDPAIMNQIDPGVAEMIGVNAGGITQTTGGVGEAAQTVGGGVGEATQALGGGVGQAVGEGVGEATQALGGGVGQAVGESVAEVAPEIIQGMV